MTNVGISKTAVAVATMLLAFVNAGLRAGCEDDPAGCAGPRSWKEDFSQDPMVASPGDWQSRGAQELPEYQGGKAGFDGLVSQWMLIDTAEHYFEGETRIHIVMDANPAEEADLGAGWWVNADNEGQQGGFYAINGVLARNIDGDQEYQFGPAWAGVSEIIPVAEGGVDVTVSLIPDEDEGLMDVVYSITDTKETLTGEFSIFPARGPGVAVPDKWFTLFANATGQGIVDFVEVINQPSDLVPGDYNANGQLDAADLDLQAEQMVLNPVPPPAGYDLNNNGKVDYPDRAKWLHDLKKTWVGDSDLNGLFESADFVAAFQAGKYEVAGAKATWVQGDWDGNQLFTSADFVAAFADGGYEAGPRPTAVSAVPEPSGMLPAVIGLLFCIGNRLRRERTTVPRTAPPMPTGCAT